MQMFLKPTVLKNFSEELHLYITTACEQLQWIQHNCVSDDRIILLTELRTKLKPFTLQKYFLFSSFSIFSFLNHFASLISVHFRLANGLFIQAGLVVVLFLDGVQNSRRVVILHICKRGQEPGSPAQVHST